MGGVFMNIYDRIKERREELNMSQTDLAKKAGYTSRTSISKIESGKVDLTQSKIIALANALDLDTSDFVDLDIDIGDNYFLDTETVKKAWEIHNDPNAKILLDAKRNLEQEDLDAITNMIKRLMNEK
jgi:transcriptional regulator with XRE-family HTH domain